MGSERDIYSEDQEYEEQQHEPSKLSSNEVLNDLEGIQFSGIRVFDTIRPELTKSYFEVEISHERKYIHKQTACWILTENKSALSNDRLTRVMEK